MQERIVPKAGRREWIGLAVILLPTLLYAMDLTVLHLAVPAISRDLAPTSAQLPGSSTFTASWLPARCSLWAPSATASVAASSC